MLTTRETVLRLTPATSATSRIVGLRTTWTVEGVFPRRRARVMPTPRRSLMLATPGPMTTNVTSCRRNLPRVIDFVHDSFVSLGLPAVDNDRQTGVASGPKPAHVGESGWPKQSCRIHADGGHIV